MTREERLELLKQIEKDIYVLSIESTLLDDAKNCAIHSVIEELEQELTTEEEYEYVYIGNGAYEKRPKVKNDLGVDCISRQGAIDAIRRIHPIDTDYDCTLFDKDDVMYVLNDMPSVTPQLCGDAISRQALLNATVNKNSIWNKITDSKGENLEAIISKLPSVTPQEQKKDQAVKCLQIENDFVCKAPSWYNCAKCNYYYNINFSRCIKREIKEWALYHAARAESEDDE